MNGTTTSYPGFDALLKSFSAQNWRGALPSSLPSDWLKELSLDIESIFVDFELGDRRRAVYLLMCILHGRARAQQYKLVGKMSSEDLVRLGTAYQFAVKQELVRRAIQGLLKEGEDAFFAVVDQTLLDLSDDKLPASST